MYNNSFNFTVAESKVTRAVSFIEVIQVQMEFWINKGAWNVNLHCIRKTFTTILV
jgi:hypothetical protein